MELTSTFILTFKFTFITGEIYVQSGGVGT